MNPTPTDPATESARHSASAPKPTPKPTPRPAPKGVRRFLAYFASKEFWVLLGILFGSTLLLLTLFFYLVLPLITRHNDSQPVPQVASLAQAKQFVSLEEGAQLLAKADLNYEVIDSGLFIPDFPPMAIIGQEPEAGSHVKAGRTVYLKVNRSTPPLVKFPNVMDIGFNQARYILENWRLRVGQIHTEPGMGTNLVMRAFYKDKQLIAGDMVPEQSRIDLVVSEGVRRQLVAVPDLVGKSLEYANNTVRELGLTIANVEFVDDRKMPLGQVISQKPTSLQDSVQVGSSVWLKVNGKPTETPE